jgi:hypothetical protein
VRWIKAADGTGVLAWRDEFDALDPRLGQSFGCLFGLQRQGQTQGGGECPNYGGTGKVIKGIAGG